MKEREFQGWVIATAEAFGWRCWHVPTPMQPTAGGKFVPSQRGRGLPDLIMLHEDPPRLIFAELKGDGGKLSDDQREFLRLARAVAGAAFGIAPAVQGEFDGEWINLGYEKDASSRVARVHRSERPVGVYSWRPGLEPVIETVLRGKVLA